jgi:hypothetical protein
MTKSLTITIRNHSDAHKLLETIKGQEYPLTLTFKPGEDSRSNRQNRLSFEWYNDASKQGDQEPWEYRAYCKLHFGVPILRAEREDFRLQYDEIVKPLPYAEKLALMIGPIELPVTSLMTVKQMSKYLDAVWQHFTGLGFQLTDPQLMGLEQGRY